MVIRSDLLKPDYIDRYGGDTRKLETPILEHPFLQAEKIDLPPEIIKASTRNDRVAQLIQLLRDAEESGDDDLAQVVRSDLFKEFGLEMNQGGMMGINDMTGPISSPKRGYVDGPGSYAGEDDFPFGKPGDPDYSPGVDPKGDPLKDTRRAASVRTSPTKPWDVYLKDAGYTKNADIDDVKRFAKKGRKIKVGQIIGSNNAFRTLLNALNVEQGTQEATNVLNQILEKKGKSKYVPVTKAGKDIVEELISVVTNTEPGKRKKDVNVAEDRNKAAKKIKDLKTQGNKLHGANPSKTKNVFFKKALERMWPILKNTTKGAVVLSATLAQKALGKALGPLDLLITKEMGSGELTPELIEEEKKYQAQRRMNEQELMKGLMQGEPEIKISAKDALAYQKKQNMRGGGLMDIDYMTRPLGYKEGGDINRDFDRMSMLRRAMEETETQRLKDMRTGDPEMERTSTYGTITEDNIIDLAEKIATQQGDTSQKNLDLIINQLQALVPSIEETSRVEGTYLTTKGLQSLVGKIRSIMNPDRRDRGVGFGRVR